MSGPDGTDTKRDRLRPGRYLRIAERTWYILLCVVAVFVIGGAVVAGASVSPSFCGLCHGAHSSRLAESGHDGVSCDACHTTPGPFGVASSRVAVMGMVYDRFMPGTGSSDTFVPSGRCLTCHEDDLSGSKVTRGIRMNHKGLDSAEWPCTRCHPTTAHGAASYRQNGYSMDSCLPCHNTNPSNPATCALCHPNGSPTAEGGEPTSGEVPTPWEVSHGKNVRSTHGMGDLNTCKACHAPEYCVSCHDLQLPHPEGYLHLHGEQTAALGVDGCLTCHKQASCDACHGVEMPHPDEFLQGHPKTAAGESSDMCLRCHTAETCQECHIRSTHPGLPPDVRDQLQQRPVS